MERHRWLWAVGTAIGLQMTMMPSSIAQIAFLRHSPWLKTLDAALSESFLNEAIVAQVSTSSQQQTNNTVAIAQTDWGKPHILTIQTTADLSGEIVINGDRVAKLTAHTTKFDVAPYLTKHGTTTIAIAGTSFPRNATIGLQFNGPNIAISQQSSGVDLLDYQLNIKVDEAPNRR